jgi:hypothetical protein
MPRTPLLIALVAVLVALDVGAQDVPVEAPKPPRVFPEQVVAPEEGFVLASRVIFVVDQSSSMSKDKLRQAVDSCLLILQNPDDGWRVGMIGFTTTFTRWHGAPECVKHDPGPRAGGGYALRRDLQIKVTPCSKHCVPAGWAAMPKSYEKAEAWLTSLASSGGTTPHPALEAALTDPVRGLTVVFVSDGEDYKGDECVKTIEKANAWRKKNGLARAGVMVWGAGPHMQRPDSAYRKVLVKIAKAGGGGMWVHGEKRTGPW